ncbi:Vacuolar protein sorting-associated protein 64 [Candida viswanathii]|uniref:Vacuolar protein sorting-associated protein 64 n=1 Tax=Candida viswanathii TaxID=5486 RepID=A0A367Y370_9ASCO|nr:Vacuolar protein sorting-associated protein 64 [Candida viswanathii]
MTDIPIALDSSQLLHNNNTSTHQHHQLAHHKHLQLKQPNQATNQQPQQLQLQLQQQAQLSQQQSAPQPFPNLEIKKNGLVYIKSSNSLSNGTKSSTGLSRTASNTGTNSPLDSKSSPSTSTSTATSSMSSMSSTVGRKRSNSQSQVIAMPGKPKYSGASARDQPKSSLSTMPSPLAPNSSASGSLLPKSSHGPSPLNPRKRNQIQYYVTLLPLNDTFIKKHLPVATYPETTKLGRPTGTKHKPDVTNGYFDSRVLSRNHAQIYIDPKNGKLMLQDLGSSNGTYLNDVRLNNDPTEVKMGDVVCLGFNVQAESTHKQISLKIENINVISTQLENGSGNGADGGNLYGKGLDNPEFRHISFIEDICNQVEKKSKQSQDGSPHVAPKHQLSYENYLFNDVNTELDDYLLGLYSSSNTGIYNNSRIGSPSCVESIVSVLLMNLTKVKQQNIVLQELFKDYENFKSLSVDQNRKLDSLGKKLKESEQGKSHLNSLLSDLKCKTSAIDQERDHNEKEVKSKLDRINSLEEQIRELQEEKEKHEREKKEKEEQEERRRAEQEELAKQRETVTVSEIDEQVRQQQELNNFIADLSRTPSFKNTKIQPEPIKCDVEPFPTVEEHSHSESEHSTPPPRSLSLSPSQSQSQPEKQTSLSVNKRSKLAKSSKYHPEKLVKFAQDNAPHIQTFTIAMSAMIIGYFFKKLTE